jgi:hypothetical protein
VLIGQLTQQSGARGYFAQADFSAGFDLVGFAQSMAERLPSLQQLDRCKANYFGCERNSDFHSFSNSAATAGGGDPISVDLPFCTTLP